MDRKLKITLTILLIILLSIISFAGLFMQKGKNMENLLPEYKLGMDLKGHRAITIQVSDEKETKYYDKDGKEVDEEVKDGSKKEIPVNSEELLTKENYLKTKELIDQRMSDLNISEYLIRLNEENGTITVELPEDGMTDIASQFLYSQGKFTIENEDGQVLLDNSNLKNVQVGYSNQTTGTTVYLSFEFNKDSIEKLKEITNTYVSSKDEEGKDTSKKVVLKLDGSTLLETSFEEEIADGKLMLTLGTSTDNATLNSYIEQASNIAILLNNGPLPIEYTVEQNRFIKSDLTLEDAVIPAIVVAVILVIALVVMMIRYKKSGVLATISYIGYLAILLIVIRYTNLVLTVEGICGILILAVLNYILLVYLLQNLKKADMEEYKNVYNKSMLSVILVLIPTMIIGIVLCFATWLPAYSFGTIIFWGILIMALYNAFVTRILLVSKNKAA